MKILVTGGAGFIASHLVDFLIEEGHKVIVVDNLSTGNRKNINKKALFYKLDIRDPRIGRIFKKEKPQISFHFAANIDVKKSLSNPVEDANANILGSINVLENCAKYKVKKVIFSSTGGGIYGEAAERPTKESSPANPVSPYGLSKLAVEQYLHYYHQHFDIPFISLRFSNVYGPRQNAKGESGVMAIFCRNMALGKDLVINGDGRQTRDFVYVADAVEAAVAAMKTKQAGIFNIGTARETNINAIFEAIKEEGGSRSKKVYLKNRSGGQKRSCLDYSKAKKFLHWKPEYTLEEGIKNTLAWYVSNLHA